MAVLAAALMGSRLFSPAGIDPSALEAATVGRAAVLDRLTDRLRALAAAPARPHTLVVGGPGSGKTHALLVALHRARRSPAVGPHLAVAWPPGDGLGIGSYEDLLTAVLRAAPPIGSDTETPASPQPPLAWPGADQPRSAVDLERAVISVLGGRVLVLVLEDLDRVFGAVGASGQSALRGFVESSASIMLLATAPRLFPAVSGRDHAWYGSFDAEHLDDLSVAEGAELVRRDSGACGHPDVAAFVQTDIGRRRLTAVHAVLGGSPRVWGAVAARAGAAELEAVAPAVEAVLDLLGPSAHLRLARLAAGEQKLLMELGRHVGARTVNELADAVGTTNRAAASALGRLADAGLVRGRKQAATDQRLTFYEVRDLLLLRHLQTLVAAPLLHALAVILAVWHEGPGAGADRGSAVPPADAAAILRGLLWREAPDEGSHSRRSARLTEPAPVSAPVSTSASGPVSVLPQPYQIVLAGVLAAAQGDPLAAARLPAELQPMARRLGRVSYTRDQVMQAARMTAAR